MKTVLGYKDGHTLWSENTPGANPGSVPLRGELVRAPSPPPKQRGPEARQREYAAKRERRKAEAA